MKKECDIVDHKHRVQPFIFTVVTYNRKRILCLGDNPVRLKQSMEAVKDGHLFTIDAIVLLPDHLHCIWTLPTRVITIF